MTLTKHEIIDEGFYLPAEVWLRAVARGQYHPDDGDGYPLIQIGPQVHDEYPADIGPKLEDFSKLPKNTLGVYFIITLSQNMEE